MATVSPLPRTHRITLASPSAGPFEVGFRLFEADALAVFVDGTETAAFTVDATFLNGYDDAATITLSASQPTSTVIQIDGAMVPAREDDYLNGPGLLALMNIEMARIWATLSEHDMQLARAILGLSDVDAADARGRRIKNLGAPEESDDALRASDVQAIVAGGGNVPSPLVGQIGHLFQATGAGTFGWVSRLVALGAALEAIRALTPAADRMPYFTDASGAALATLTSFARSMLDDADAAAARNTLELGALNSVSFDDITITGDVYCNSPGSVEWRLDKNASTNLARIWGETNASRRWALDLGDATAESGANAGSNFLVKRYDDAGTFLADAFALRRDTGACLIYGEITMVNNGKIVWNAGPSINVGAGSPEGVVTAPIGSLFLRTNGGAGTSLYVKQSGTGNTGWVGK